MTNLKAVPLTPAIGAELTGVDFTKPLSESVCDAIYDALLTYQVIFFRDQQLTPESHLAFARNFGEPEHRHPVYPHAEGFPDVMLLDVGPENPPDNDQWHADVTFKAEPPFASILHSRIIPPLGGDTLWSSMTAAYEALPTAMKDHINGLRAVHDMSDFRNLYTMGEPDGSATKLNDAHQRFGSAIHPMVKVHPMTGKPAIYANPGYTMQVEGLTSAESRRLLTYLFDFMNQPHFQVRFRWTENCIAMWDNRCTMHYAIADYLPHRRLMHRVTVTNDRRADQAAAERARRSA
jgi:taurine dioxygenase